MENINSLCHFFHTYSKIYFFIFVTYSNPIFINVFFLLWFIKCWSSLFFCLEAAPKRYSKVFNFIKTLQIKEKKWAILFASIFCFKNLVFPLKTIDYFYFKIIFSTLFINSTQPNNRQTDRLDRQKGNKKNANPSSNNKDIFFPLNTLLPFDMQWTFALFSPCERNMQSIAINIAMCYCTCFLLII